MRTLSTSIRAEIRQSDNIDYVKYQGATLAFTSLLPCVSRVPALSRWFTQSTSATPEKV
jgi:hypothetical protein